MFARQPEQDQTLFPVTTVGFVGFLLGGLSILAAAIFMAIWSSPDNWLGSGNLSGAETFFAVTAALLGIAAAGAATAAMAVYGERARIDYSIIVIGLLVATLLIMVLV